MLTGVPLEAQLEAAAGDETKVLVVGAGVAGVTLAQLLRGQGLHPVLVEREPPEGDTGYMIALFPLVDPAFEVLGVRAAYDDASVPLRRYRLRDRHGHEVREYGLSGLVDVVGDYRGLDRGALLGVLAGGGGAVTYECAVTALDRTDEAVSATLAGGATSRVAAFDLVVATDGLHSATRGLVLSDDQVSVVDTKWGGWVAWIDPDEEMDLGEELWGAGFFFGSYPVRDRIGVFVGGPRSKAEADAGRFADLIRAGQAPRACARLSAALEAVRGEDAYFWSLTDCRSATWASGRVLLLGDAAAGFLPTAGIGAGMAMESAWVLGTMLEGVRPERVPDVLARFERDQRPRVESAQKNSRQLARLMFHESELLAAVRDLATRFVTMEMALGPIRRLIRDRPHPQPARTSSAS